MKRPRFLRRIPSPPNLRQGVVEQAVDRSPGASLGACDLTAREAESPPNTDQALFWSELIQCDPERRVWVRVGDRVFRDGGCQPLLRRSTISRRLYCGAANRASSFSATHDNRSRRPALQAGSRRIVKQGARHTPEARKSEANTLCSARHFQLIGSRYPISGHISDRPGTRYTWFRKGLGR